MKAVDRVGAETTWSDTFRVDTRPPDLIVEAPSNGQVRPPYVGVTASIVVRPTILVAEPMVAHGTAVDAGAATVKVDASMDGTPIPVAGTDEWQTDPVDLPLGFHTLRVAATDAVGHKVTRTYPVWVILAPGSLP